MPRKAQTQKRLEFGILSTLIGFHLRMAQLIVYDDFMRGAPVNGLTPGQCAILILIDANKGLTQQQLCDGIRIEKSTLVVRLHRLAERGLVKRIRSTDDRRQNTLELTSEGRKSLRTMIEYVSEHEQRLLADLSPTERKQLVGLLAKIASAYHNQRRAQRENGSAIERRRAERVETEAHSKRA